MKNILLLVAIVFFNYNNTYSQYVSIKTDTVTLYRIDRVDTDSHIIVASSLVLKSDSVIYYFNNFPFHYFDCLSKNYPQNDIFFDDYKQLIDKKSIKKMFKSFNKKHAKFLDKMSFDKDMNNLVNCLNTEYKNEIVMTEKKMVATFIVIKCSQIRGVSDALFCEGELNTKECPVLLKVW